MGLNQQIAQKISQLKDRAFWCVRLSLFVILAWIGSLKFADYEARGIVPLLAHSPLGKWLYHHAPSYQEHTQDTPTDRAWHQQNKTYQVSYAIGALELFLALLLLLGLWFPLSGMVGGLLVAGMGLVTLSFIITTPGIWMPHLGFPYLSGGGQSLLKDLLLFSGGLLVASLDAQRWLEHKGLSSTPTQTTCGKKGCCG
ncbi:YkgB family protein [Helicobacter bizzozeronii]|uniref:YkgB family protein n=1 Tax=Helicobacter bizzozeronii TaxID=56877 RepID=UPI000CEEB0ED|nr:YkgB family protein [Helicobacter bizzozeronii]